MSRSNPNEQSSHPAVRWFEWSGSEGVIQYYDKENKENVSVGDDFTFILLDQLSVIKGWHDPSESGITSNEVKDTTSDAFLVKAFKGGVLAQGFYSQIRDRVKAQGGKFTSNLYIAFKNNGRLAIGSLQFSGAALNAWVDFKNANKVDVYKKSVKIKGSTDGKKGSVKFKTPKFFINEITKETDEAAVALDTELQTFLRAYFQRTAVEKIATQPRAEAEPESNPFNEPEGSPDPETGGEPDLSDPF